MKILAIIIGVLIVGSTFGLVDAIQPKVEAEIVLTPNIDMENIWVCEDTGHCQYLVPSSPSYEMIFPPISPENPFIEGGEIKL